MIKKLAKSIREYKKDSIISMLLITLEVIMEVLIPLIMAYLLDEGISKSNLNVIIISGIILIFTALLSLLFGTLAGIKSAKASCGFGKNLRHDIYHKVQDYSFSNIDKFSTSSIITRLTTDVSNVQMSYQMLIRITVRAPLMLIFSLCASFFINARISLIFLLAIIVLGSALFSISKKAHPMFEKVFSTYDDLNNNVQENIRGIRVVKSFVREDYEKSKFNNVSKKIYERFIKAEKLVSYNAPIMQLSMYACILFISWFGTLFITDGSMQIGDLTSLIAYSGSILSSLMMVSMIYVMMTISLTSASRIVELLDEEPTILSSTNSIKDVKDGNIEFKNVSFSYVNKKDKLSLKNINLNIKSGETIGIIGSTGSSKTTLVNLISRLYDVTDGEILVGGVNVKDYDLKSLRDNVSVVLQKNVLFSGTIEENLRWGNKNATKKEIKEACSLAQADEFIEKFPDKYNTHIEQGATNISGGQKQRLCIARALLKKPKILILDDSTSAVDTKTDKEIREGLKNYLPNVTKLIIAQRISSIETADKVIILENGEIVDFDTPKNLLKNNSIYKEIYNSQIKGGDK